MAKKKIFFSILLITAFIMILFTGRYAMGSIIEEILFSKKEYNKNIEVRNYLISEKILGDILNSGWDKELIQETYEELFQKTSYLVVRVKNKGRLASWGIMRCFVDKIEFKINVNVGPNGIWKTYIISWGKFTEKKGDKYPTIEYVWEKLYAK